MRPVTIEDTRVVRDDAATSNGPDPIANLRWYLKRVCAPGAPLLHDLDALESRLATAEAERDRLLRFVTDGNALLARFSETRAYGCVTVYRMPETRSWFDTPEAAVTDWLRAPSTGGTP